MKISIGSSSEAKTGCAGKGFGTLFFGSLAGAEAARRNGEVVSAHVIARPADETAKVLPAPAAKPAARPTPAAPSATARRWSARG